MNYLFTKIKEFITGVGIERQTEFWIYPKDYEGFLRIETRRKVYEQEMVNKGWKVGGITCRCCNVGFYRYVKVWPWGRP